jgi:sugar lactone lactonase YvrE
MSKLACACTLSIAVSVLSQTASLQVKGGEEETGPYEVVSNWPRPFVRQGYMMGSIAGVFAESANRVFIAMRGEVKIPEKRPDDFAGFWGSLGGRRGAMPASSEMRNCIFIVDDNGKVIESWTAWDGLFESDPSGFGGPHTIKINPFDPQRHIWVVNEIGQQIYEFTNDGKQLVMTLGEKGVAGNDDRHFGRPQDVAWLPDGSIVVADGLGNSRVVKFDKSGKFLTAWGSKGNGPGQFSGPHAIETDRNGRIYVADRGNSRIQVFDENGRHLDAWPDIRFPDHLVITPDQRVWVSDGTTGKMLQYDMNGKLLFSWGVNGTFPGAHWELHGFSADAEGNLYTADSYAFRAQKFRPKHGVDRSKLLTLTPLGSPR